MRWKRKVGAGLLLVNGPGGGEEAPPQLGLGQTGEADTTADGDPARWARRTVRVEAEDCHWRRVTLGGLPLPRRAATALFLK